MVNLIEVELLEIAWSREAALSEGTSVCLWVGVAPKVAACDLLLLATQVRRSLAALRLTLLAAGVVRLLLCLRLQLGQGDGGSR